MTRQLQITYLCVQLAEHAIQPVSGSTLMEMAVKQRQEGEERLFRLAARDTKASMSLSDSC